MEVLLEKVAGMARPVDETGWKLLGKMENGERFVADIRDPTRRSGKNHRFFFALLNELFENQEGFGSFDNFRSCLLIALGFCDVCKINGREIPVAHSLKFGSMRQTEFESLTTAVLNWAEHHGFDRDQLLAKTMGA